MDHYFVEDSSFSFASQNLEKNCLELMKLKKKMIQFLGNFFPFFSVKIHVFFIDDTSK